MAYNVKFLRGSEEAYTGLSVKDSNTFYNTGSNLYLGEIKLSNGEDLAAAILRVATNEGDIAKLKTDLGALVGGESGSISDMIDAAVKVVSDKLGDVSTLKTDAKVAVAAINEVHDELDAYKTATDAAIDAIEADYLKAADKAELSGAINTAKSELNTAIAGEKTRAEAAEKTLTDNLAAEVTRATNAEKANADAIAAVKEDVDTFFANADLTENAKDTLKEIQDYINSDQSGAADMLASINQNKNNITAIDGRVTAVEGKVATLESEMDAVEGRASDLESAVEALQGSVGEGGSVDEKISAAVAAETEARETAITEVTGLANAAQTAANKAQSEVDALELVVAEKAAASDVTALSGKVTTVEGKVATLEGEMDAVEGRAAAVENRATALEGLVGTTKVSEQITTAIGGLDKADTAVDGQYVSAVSEENGIITVSRKALPDAQGMADAALAAAKSYADQAEADAIASAATDAQTKANTAETNAKAHAETQASSALTEAKAYTDNALSWGQIA